MVAVNQGPSVAQSRNFQSVLNLNRGLQQLFVLRNANMRTTQDQLFTRTFNGQTWDPFFITAVRKSGAYSVSCLGGIFTGAAKTGSAIVAVGQSYAGLTGNLTHVNCTIQASTVTFTETPILSLSTANSADLLADFYIIGVSYDDQ